MLLKSFIVFLGKLFSYFPDSVNHGLCKSLGLLFFYIFPKRRRTTLSNLHHTFPEKPRHWHQGIAKKSYQNMMEMGFMLLLSPHWSKEQLRARFKIAPAWKEALTRYQETGRSNLVLIPHFTLMEALTNIGALTDEPLPEIGVIFRPLKSEALDQWVKETRERFGGKLLSRKAGFNTALKILHENGAVCLLFDQNAGRHGILTTSFGRIASTTDLPAILAKKFQPRIRFAYVEKTGFCKGTLHLEEGPPAEQPEAIMPATDRWLEEKLRSDEALCTNWLWSHARWKCQDIPKLRFRLESKRDGLKDTLAFQQKDELDKMTRFWIRMPNWLGDVIMALPLLRALRKARPDAHLTLLIQPHFAELIERFELADRIIPLPRKKTWGYLNYFKTLRHDYPDTHILFTNSARGDLEAKTIGAPQRFGLERPSKPRKRLTHTWQMPSDLNESTLHQTRLWEKMFNHFGLQEQLDLTPFSVISKAQPIPFKIGLFCGSENSPEKRWPVAHWRALITQLIAANASIHFALFGTSRDKALTQEIALGFDSNQVSDEAGKTSLANLVDEIQSCQLIIGNDSGGIHIANALGRPLIGIFGPTNPVRTGPIFNTPFHTLQPPQCPPTGGKPIEQVTPERVCQTALESLTAESPS